MYIRKDTYIIILYIMMSSFRSSPNFCPTVSIFAFTTKLPIELCSGQRPSLCRMWET